MTGKPISSGDLQAQINDLKIQTLAIVALIASLPGAAGIDAETPHDLLRDHIIDPANDGIGNDQIAAAMHTVQRTLAFARKLDR